MSLLANCFCTSIWEVVATAYNTLGNQWSCAWQQIEDFLQEWQAGNMLNLASMVVGKQMSCLRLLYNHTYKVDLNSVSIQQK